jgi:hypothetical protein
MPTSRLKNRVASCETSRFRAQKIHVHCVALSPRLPAISVVDLAVMLEIDLLMGRRKDFVSRLQKALNSVASNGY